MQTEATRRERAGGGPAPSDTSRSSLPRAAHAAAAGDDERVDRPAALASVRSAYERDARGVGSGPGSGATTSTA